MPPTDPAGAARCAPADGRPARVAAGAAAVLAAGLLAHAAPSLAAISALRRRAFPDLAGVGAPTGIALTFDDGPDRESTPAFLHLLAEMDVRATFFLLGRMLDADPGLGREIVAQGHEVAVHGWDHRCLLWRTRGRRTGRSPGPGTGSSR